MSYVVDFLINNSIHIILSVAITLLFARSRAITKNAHLFFRLILILNFVLLVSTYIDTEINFAEPAVLVLPRDAILRNWAAGISYTIKSAMVGIMLLAFHRVPKNRRTLALLPVLLNGALAFSSIFTGWVYSIDDKAIFHDGPLKDVYMAMIYFYFTGLLILLLINIKKSTKIQTISSLAIVALCTVSTTIGMTVNVRFNFLGMSIIVSIMLYFLSDFVSLSNLAIKHKDEELEQKQLRLMMSQIQPHFLYNTLSAIRDMCREEPLLAEKTLLDFSSYLRNNLDFGNNTNPMIPVEKELEHTKLYTNIEMTRFSQLAVEYDVQDGDYEIPFLTVQPMVENAIRHGARGVRNGRVWVVLTKETAGDKVYHKIVVRDNGIGKKEEPALGNHRGIGIANVKSRLESLCMGSVDVNFSSEGTTVTILIPADGIKM